LVKLRVLPHLIRYTDSIPESKKRIGVPNKKFVAYRAGNEWLRIDKEKWSDMLTSNMKYKPLSADFYKGTRDRLAKEVCEGSLVIIHANDVYPTNADGTLAHHQNANLFYVTGIDQEESVLVMSIGKNGEHHDTLLLRETNETIAIWEGARLSKDEASALSGIEDVRWTDEYDTLLSQCVPSAKLVWLEENQHPRCTNPVQTRNARKALALKKAYPSAKIENIYPILGEMRLIKQPEEIEQLKVACQITGEGYRELLSYIKPGMGEWEVEAKLSYEYLKRGARKFSFLPIIASGDSTCVLHYIVNDKVCKDGDLVLLDIGAEYGNYNGDMTRTIPVNGKYSPRQRAVYDAVLRTHNYAKSIMRPGTPKTEYERLVRVFVGHELVKLGLLTEKDLADNPNDPPAVRRYFMHGCSHSLGLDVHDVGNSQPTFKANMVFTVEPGIYIREEGIGIRLETDVLIGEESNTDLLDGVPLDPDEIERLMSK
jgi:Xaa-Pro aminopeptidase